MKAKLIIGESKHWTIEIFVGDYIDEYHPRKAASLMDVHVHR